MVFVPMASTECNSLNPIPSHCHSPIGTNQSLFKLVSENTTKMMYETNSQPRNRNSYTCKDKKHSLERSLRLGTIPREWHSYHNQYELKPEAEAGAKDLSWVCSLFSDEGDFHRFAFGCYWLYVRRSQGLARGQSKGGSCKKATWAFPEMAYTKFMATCMLHFLESYPESYPRKHWTGKGRRWTPVFFCGCASNAPRFAQGQSKGGSCKRAQDP